MSWCRRSPLAVVVFLLACRGANSAGSAGTSAGTTGDSASGMGGGSSGSATTDSGTTFAKAGSESAGGLSGGAGGPSPFPDCVPPTWQATCSDGWCEIPSGCFVMGSPEDEWGHAPIEEQQVPVTLTRSFEIQQHEVTQAEWTASGYTNPSGLLPNGHGDCADPDCPVGNVTWMEAVAYANLLSGQHDPPLEPCYLLNGCTGAPGVGLECASAEATKPTVYECEGYRLPTDAEWEYAARAGTTTAFYSGNITVQPEDYTCYADPNLEKVAWYCNNADDLTRPVMGLAPNPWGLYDPLGNAYEWVNDESDGLPAISEVDPDGRVRQHTRRNRRGGAFSGWPTLCRAADQLEGNWNFRQPGIGFRLARTLP